MEIEFLEQELKDSR